MLHSIVTNQATIACHRKVSFLLLIFTVDFRNKVNVIVELFLSFFFSILIININRIASNIDLFVYVTSMWRSEET